MNSPTLLKRKNKNMGINKLKNMAGIMAMAMTLNEEHNFNDEPMKEPLTKEDREKNRIERLKKKGVKEYFYGENVIYARNKKNADRKAKNKGYL